MPWTSNVRIPHQQSKSSPALCEFRNELHMVHAGSSSNDIWHSVTSDGTTWSDNFTIVDQRSKAPSALASFQNRLHITHLGDSSNQIWHSSFDGNHWTTNAKIEGEKSQAAPAMAVFQNKLHLLHIGDTSKQIFHLEFDGVHWTKRGANEGLQDQRSKGAVALSVFNGELHMVHQGESSNRLWHTRFNGSAWSVNQEIPGQLSKSPPALAEFNGLLHMVHLGDSSNHIWHSTFDGTTFATNISIPYQLSKAAPALAAFGGRLHMVHLGDESNDIWHTTSDGVLVRIPAKRVVIVDIDGVRWENFYRHLKTVRDAGARADVTYTFHLQSGASDDTVLDDGGIELTSGLGELCFFERRGIVDVRLALTSYPSFTFPTHGTMYTGVWPGKHAITGHSFNVHDAPPEWDQHSWDSLPRAPALQGYCTDAESSAGALADWLWGGFDTVGPNSCRNRNRGLVTDLRVENVFEFVHEAGLRSTSIHSFYHGAARPWETEGKDQWWRYSPPELRSIKDACSDEDLDQYETVDHGALIKAELLLEFMPSTVKVFPPPNLPNSIPATSEKRSGGRKTGYGITGDAHPEGAPDLIAIYLASVDQASHVDGIRNQSTYLAWFDHRLARFVKALQAKDPDAFAHTVFAFIADHGHSRIVSAPDTEGLPEDNSMVVREELVRILFGDEDGQDFLDQAEILSAQYGISYKKLVLDAIEDDMAAWAESMNLYVYIRDPGRFAPEEVAARLLSIPMRTEPYGALVLVGTDQRRYMFMGRGETRLVEVDSQDCRKRVLPQLEMPLPSTEELDATSLTQAAWDAEKLLRDRLLTSEGFDLLRIVQRVAGFNPVTHNQSPDVILLAPASQTFGHGPATHGSFAYPPSRIPMVFCGPGIPPGQPTIETADMVDFTPTILSLLGLRAPGLDGHPLLDHDGHVLRRGTRPKPLVAPPVDVTLSRRMLPPPLRPLPRVIAVLQGVLDDRPSDKTAGKPRGRTDSALPVLVALTVEHGRPRREVTLGDARHLNVHRATTVVAGRDDAWVEVAGKRRDLYNGSEVEIGKYGATIGAKRSYGTVTLHHEYLVQAVDVCLPRVPPWLADAIERLAERIQVVVDHDDCSNSVMLVPAADFEHGVREVEALVMAASAPVEDETGGGTPPILLRPETVPELEMVRRAVKVLEGLLHKTDVGDVVLQR